MCKTDIMRKNKEYKDMMTQENLTGKKPGQDLIYPQGKNRFTMKELKFVK